VAEVVEVGLAGVVGSRRGEADVLGVVAALMMEGVVRVMLMEELVKVEVEVVVMVVGAVEKDRTCDI
jgi:hypothetical protein